MPSSGSAFSWSRVALAVFVALSPRLAIQGEGPFFSDGFESGSLRSTANGFRWSPKPVAVTPSTDVARTGKYSLRFRYKGKADCKDAWAEERFELGQRLKEVWMEYYIYFPDGTDGPRAKYVVRDQPMCKSADNGTKILRLWGSDYGAANKVGGNLGGGRGTRNGSIGLSVSATIKGKNGKTTLRDIVHVQDFLTETRRGRWLQMRWHFKLAEPGSSSGIAELWVDGTKLVTRRDLAVFDSSFNYWDQGYLMGWSNSGFTQDTDVYIDDFSVFATNPKW